MKKLIILPLVASVLAACSSAPKDTYERRSYHETQRNVEMVEKAIDKAPKWMIELPKSNSAVYENGTAVSTDMAMSVNKAKTIAYGKICMAAGGKVDQQSKTFKTDRNDVSSENSELAVRTLCPGVDITGVETVETRMIAEGGRFRTFVLVALPMGQANTLKREKTAEVQRQQNEARGNQVFSEMDQRIAKPTQ